MIGVSCLQTAALFVVVPVSCCTVFLCAAGMQQNPTNIKTIQLWAQGDAARAVVESSYWYHICRMRTLSYTLLPCVCCVLSLQTAAV